MFNRIRNIYKLAKKDPEALKKLENFTPEQLATVPEEGDGKAVFFGEGTHEEFEELEREKKGLKGIFGIGQ